MAIFSDQGGERMVQKKDKKENTGKGFEIEGRRMRK